MANIWRNWQRRILGAFMKIISRPLEALALIEVRYFHDSRGFFAETFRQEWMQELKIDAEFLQENHSRSSAKVLRGLHFQIDPPQGKLVSVRRGRIWDVAVDIRKNSPTFGQYFGAELSDTNGRLLWIPSGFAHGFCVLGEEPADVAYKVTGYYNPKTEGGLRWNDPKVNIQWPISDPILSAKDAELPGLASL